MILTNNFIFIHMMRTGGSSINKSFRHEMLGYHRPRHLIPKEHRDKPIVGNVRDPFDWYVSLYHHCLNFFYPMKTPTFLNYILDFKRYEFRETIRRLIDTSWMTYEDIDRALKHFPDEYDWNATLIDNLRKKECDSYLNSGKGFMSWLFDYMYSDPMVGTEGVFFCRTEHLEHDWQVFLKTQAPIRFPKLNRMSGLNPLIGQVKEPRRKDYMSYYDDELIKLIIEKDKSYLDFFGM